MTSDDVDRIAFDPTAAVPALADPNTEGYPVDVIEREVEHVIETMTSHVRECYRTGDALVEEHRRSGTSYGLGVVHSGGREQWVRIQFDAAEPRIERGEGRIRRALFTHRIAASVLVARARNEKIYFYTLGLSRLSLITPARLENDKVVLRRKEPADLLLYHLAQRSPGAAAHHRAFLDFQLRSRA